MSEQTKLSVEEAAENYFNFHYPKGAIYKDDIIDSFKAGQNSVLNDANLVPLDKVVEILKSTEVSGFPYHLVPFSEAIDRIITQIKNLTK